MSRGKRLDIDICILGAGPHGLAAALHLSQAQPSIRLRVIDPSGAWLSTWHGQMARAEITALRSPSVHTPSPDATAFQQYLFDHQIQPSGLPYGAPLVEAFASFCTHLITETRLETPTTAQLNKVSSERDALRIETSDEIITANHLIVAANPHRPQIPNWAKTLLDQRSERFTHANNIDLRHTPNLHGEKIVIIGGGMSAAHLASGASKRGARVHLISRRPLETRNFDTAPGWLGPRNLQAFHDEPDPTRRLKMAQTARGGGTIPPWIRNHLDTLISSSALKIHEAEAVQAASIKHDETYELTLANRSTLEADRVWLATGTTPDITALACLEDALTNLPTIGAYPILSENLQLGSYPIHIMGRLATLALGPAAGNLWGARHAARRISRAITSTGFKNPSHDYLADTTDQSELTNPIVYPCPKSKKRALYVLEGCETTSCYGPVRIPRSWQNHTTQSDS